ncbi:hypothetical protein L1987_79380 [Smallanthus sonchifolius]|uniref:Uncharacterized protein n=1 Tax=Smallanthus sonchifolius TaxID=185202 RepID=A0ACB8ZF57_9ASTR|nr:hypothetical protein L1987_79380 [Smallanthus sonchifolius]
METSLPYSGDSTALRVNTNRKPPMVRSAGDASALRIHAKQTFHIDSKLQLRSYLEFPHVAHKMSLLEDDLHLLIHMLDAAYDGECMFVGFRNEDMRMKVINGVCSKEFQVRVLF